jgi:hypothetical protein
VSYPCHRLMAGELWEPELDEAFALYSECASEGLPRYIVSLMTADESFAHMLVRARPRV